MSTIAIIGITVFGLFIVSALLALLAIVDKLDRIARTLEDENWDYPRGWSSEPFENRFD